MLHGALDGVEPSSEGLRKRAGGERLSGFTLLRGSGTWLSVVANQVWYIHLLSHLDIETRLFAWLLALRPSTLERTLRPRLLVNRPRHR
jgi:hypothetical protein